MPIFFRISLVINTVRINFARRKRKNNYFIVLKRNMEEKKTEVKKSGYIICRVCGYIDTADKIDQVCPACGFPKTVWMEYKPRKINETRRHLLDLHIHPIAVHFPIVGSAMTFILPLLALIVPFIPILPEVLDDRFYEAAWMISLVLPLMAIMGAITGYIGGKLRYKTNKAPILKQKIVLSIAYLVVTLAQCYVAYDFGVNAGNALIVIILGIISSVLAAILGKMGSYLFAGKFGPYVAG